ncbi:hypothetical protein [Cellulomonas citrea]|uniref:hypothetical protein n=1 Tax=Cellulomonas citrea TaxID=1909423 RepID=UPI00135A3AEB|nr:hypothetical protein [Cellulomonas citrea]
MGYVEAIKDFEHGRLADARASTEGVIRDCPTVVPRFVRVYLDIVLPRETIVPPFDREWLVRQISEPIIAGIQESCRYLLEVIDELDGYVDWIGGPETLRGAAAAIQAEVADPSAAMYTTIRDAPLAAVTSWNGPAAADLYRMVPMDQANQLHLAQGYLSTLGDVLRGMADQIETFYVSLSAVIAGVIGAVAGVVVAVATGWSGVGAVAGIVVAIAGALSALAGVAGLVLSTVQTSSNLLVEASNGFGERWSNYMRFATVQ